MSTQNTTIVNLPTLFTGLAQAAAIGTFALVLTMYVNQSVMAEKQKNTTKDIDELKLRVTNLEMILPERVREKKSNSGPRY